MRQAEAELAALHRAAEGEDERINEAFCAYTLLRELGEAAPALAAAAALPPPAAGAQPGDTSLMRAS